MCMSSYSPPPVTPLPPPPANPAQPQLAPIVANGGEDVSKKVQDLTSNLTPLVIPYEASSTATGGLTPTNVPRAAPPLTEAQFHSYYGPGTGHANPGTYEQYLANYGTTAPAQNQGSLPGGNGSYRYNPSTNTVLTIQPAANRLSPTSTRTG